MKIFMIIYWVIFIVWVICIAILQYKSQKKWQEHLTNLSNSNKEEKEHLTNLSDLETEYHNVVIDAIKTHKEIIIIYKTALEICCQENDLNIEEYINKAKGKSEKCEK